MTKYQYWIIGIYVALFPLCFLLTPNVLRYEYSNSSLSIVLIIVIVTFSIFAITNRLFRFRVMCIPRVSIFRYFRVFGYAVLFAVPEEILFRGIIQGGLQGIIDNSVLVILLSSLVFGLAHLPNGAKGFSMQKWNWRFAGLAFLAGIPLCLIFHITQSLLIPTGLHMAYLGGYLLFTREE